LLQTQVTCHALAARASGSYAIHVVVVILLVVLEVPFAVVSTLLAVRLLGARRSWVATALAGTIGWVGGNVLQVALNGWDWDAARLSVATVAISVVFTMLAAVSLDFLARPGTLARGAGAGLLVMPSPVRDLRRRLAPYARYRQIIDIARRNGLPVPGVSRRRSIDRVPVEVALRTTLEEGGVVFVKLGQMASTREDLLPSHVRLELSRLQSSVEPLPREVMQAQLEAELDESVDRVFAEFDWDPIGSASIAQAYAARLQTGEPVVVKVQRPAIEEAVARDTTALLHLARAVERRTPQGRQLHVAEIAEEFAHNLRLELDFPLEAANAVDLAGATDPASGVRIPRMYRELSSAGVLVQERLIGQSVANHDRIAASGLDETELADRLVQTVAKHMLSHGHFHADPHPGNVLLLDDGALGLIDFGSTGRLDPRQRTALLEMTMAAMRGDGAGLRDAIEQVAIVGGEGNDAALERALARFLSEHVGGGRSISAKALNDLVPLLGTFDIRLPGELSVFFRALVLLDGTARTICPGYSLVDGMGGMVDGGIPAIDTGASIQDRLVEGLLAELPRLRRLPSQLDRIVSLTGRGELRTRIALFTTEQDARVITTLINRIVLGVVGGLLVIGSSVLLMVSDGSNSSVGTSLTRIFGYVGLILAAILVLRVVAAIVREGYN
jgi:ubiquinone biosynthesis protein